MSKPNSAATHYIGWDVGGWNCERNSRSRDAIVILDADRVIVGEPWRGNLRQAINEAANTTAWLDSLFTFCGVAAPATTIQITLAIDTPLGLPQALTKLATVSEYIPEVGSSDTNPYLFRYTERNLFGQGFRPLSAVKDMIGSQATKGMHVVAKFAPIATRCGVWSDGKSLTTIEAYPSPCKGSATMRALRGPIAHLGHNDLEDALICAMTAYLYSAEFDTLNAPPSHCPICEGWIWLPRDATPAG